VPVGGEERLEESTLEVLGAGEDCGGHRGDLSIGSPRETTGDERREPRRGHRALITRRDVDPPDVIPIARLQSEKRVDVASEQRGELTLLVAVAAEDDPPFRPERAIS